MGEIITFNEKPVKAKGLDPSTKPDENKIRSYFFSDHYENLSLLNQINLTKHDSTEHNLTLPTEKPTLFYPGCGADILFPLMYVEKLFLNLKEIKFIFNDIDDNLGVIKTILDDIGISFEENDNQIRFYWRNVLIGLEFLTGNVFSMELPSFDIYFERSFNIMKSYHQDYEENVFKKLNLNGILISDSGFLDFPLKKVNNSEKFKKLSSYGEMILGIKNKGIR